MMKDILCNTKWWGLYHMISSRSQATRQKQNTASKALWHFEVAELQSKWEAEIGKPPVSIGRLVRFVLREAVQQSWHRTTVATQ